MDNENQLEEQKLLAEIEKIRKESEKLEQEIVGVKSAVKHLLYQRLKLEGNP